MESVVACCEPQRRLASLAPDSAALCFEHGNYLAFPLSLFSSFLSSLRRRPGRAPLHDGQQRGERRPRRHRGGGPGARFEREAERDQALQAMRAMKGAAVAELVDFIAGSKRGFAHPG